MYSLNEKIVHGMIVAFVVMDLIVKIVIHEKFSVKIIFVAFVLTDHVVHYHIRHLNCPIRMNMHPYNEKLCLSVIIVMKQDTRHHHVSNYLTKNDRNIWIHQEIILKDNIIIIDRTIIMMEINSMITSNSSSNNHINNCHHNLLNLSNTMLLASNVENEG